MKKNNMITEINIGHREALTLLVFMISGKVFLSFPRDMILLGDSAGWMIALISGIFSLIGFYFINALVQRFPSQNIIEISYTVTGKFIGTFLGFLIFLYFLVLTSLLVRQFAETFILAILPRTPISIIIGFFLVLLVYGTLLGIESITRVAWFYGPYLLITLVILLAFSIPRGNILNLTPILGKGPLEIIKQSFIHISLFTEILFLGLISPLIRKKDKVFGVGFYSMTISIIINVLVTLVVISVFNYASGSRLIFPIFQLSRLIAYGYFLQRVESVFVFLWFFAAGIQLGGLFYGTVLSFAENFKINHYRPLAFPIAIIVFALSLIPESMTDTIIINDFMLSNYYWITAFGIPALLWFITIILKKRGTTNV